MKAVFMLAGIGKRLGALSETTHKSMILLGEKPLLGHLLDRFVRCGVQDILVIVGHKADDILTYIRKTYAGTIAVAEVYNQQYDTANNMYSLWCAREFLQGHEFVLCNGDMILHEGIVDKIKRLPAQISAIALDIERREEDIDSPGTLVVNGHIVDLRRHIPREKNGGYAVGLYKFNKVLSSAYFRQAGEMLDKGDVQAGFHDPLIALFQDHPVVAADIGNLPWTDIDTPDDIPKAVDVLNRIVQLEKDYSGDTK